MATLLVRAVLASGLTTVLVSSAALLVGSGSGGEGSRATTGSGVMRPSLANLPLSFIENRGQTDDRVGYYVHGADTSLYFTPRGLTVSLGGEDGDRWILEQRFVGTDPATPMAEGRLPGVVSYFEASAEEWRTAIPTYSRVAYRGVWPGIDLVYSGDATRLKYDLVVHPGADPSRIRLAWRGAAELTLTAGGDLQAQTSVRDLREEAPYVYQDTGGERTEVAASFDLGPGGTYGFDVGSYDRSRPLVIDPAMFVYAGFIGGLGTDRGQGIAADAAGNAYVTGTTRSNQTTFPVTVGPDTTHNGGAGDAFVAKVNPAAPAWSTPGTSVAPGPSGVWGSPWTHRGAPS